MLAPARQRQALMVAALCAAVYLILQPYSADLAAQVFRTQLFLVLAGVAYAIAERPREGLKLAAAALLPALAMAAAFPESGAEPFVWSAFWPVVAFALAALAVAPREERSLRTGVVLYALG